jgi:hypothetical protein
MVVDISPTRSHQAKTPLGANAVRPHLARIGSLARVAVHGLAIRMERRWRSVLAWSVFGAAFLVQAFAPRLTIASRAFVIPPALVAAGTELRPADVVARERIAQSLSAFLALSGALGLAFQYRVPLLGAVRPRPAASDGETRCGSR